MASHQQMIEKILALPNQKDRNREMAKFLAQNNLKASKQLEFNPTGKTVEIAMSLVGLDGIAKVFKFVFNNKDNLFHVYSLVKCFFNGGGTEGLFMVDGMKNMFLNMNQSLASVAEKGTKTLKMLSDNVFG